jgi:hypothetical protein
MEKQEQTFQTAEQLQTSKANDGTFKPQMYVKNSFIPSVGHPLQTNWNFWHVQRSPNVFNKDAPADSHYRQPRKPKANYRDLLKNLGQISTVE